VTKGTIHFERDRPFPAPLLKRILKARIVEINASYPKRTGEMREYYDNGFAKARGRMKGEELTGAWQWWRRDGSLMRSGAFKTGVQVGEWITYDRQGQPHRVTHFGRA
jgi:antitoxin component YwqK of YwqJK toxin-antitoxin module